MGECKKKIKELTNILTNPDNYTPFCIGTSEVLLPIVKEQGISPTICTPSGICIKSNGERAESNKSPTKIWIGIKNSKLCKIKAKKASEITGGNPLKINFVYSLFESYLYPSKEYENGEYDEEDFDISDISVSKILMNDINKECNQEEIKKAYASLPEWVKSAIYTKSVNYEGNIPLEPIGIEDLSLETEEISTDWLL